MKGALHFKRENRREHDTKVSVPVSTNSYTVMSRLSAMATNDDLIIIYETAVDDMLEIPDLGLVLEFTSLDISDQRFSWVRA